MKVNHAELQGVQLGFPPSLMVQMTVVLDVTNPNTTSWVVSNLAHGTWYFSLTAVAADGSESARTTVVAQTL